MVAQRGLDPTNTRLSTKGAASEPRSSMRSSGRRASRNWSARSCRFGWSGIAAGLAMSASIFCKGFFHLHLPAAPWRPLIENLGYCSGFVIVILSRFQLFTEQTVKAILPLLSAQSRDNLVRTARLWGTVLAANLIGDVLRRAMAPSGGISVAELAFRCSSWWKKAPSSF